MYAKQLGTGNNYFYPVREFAENDMQEYKQNQYVNMNMQEVLPKSFNSLNFNGQGQLDFEISTSNNYGIIWSRSFFRIDTQLFGKNGTRPSLADGIAFSRFVGGNIWQGSSFALSDQTVEETGQYTAQLNAINCRLGYSGSFLKTNSDLLYSDPDLYNRIQKVSDDNYSIYDRFTGFPLSVRNKYYQQELDVVNVSTKAPFVATYTVVGGVGRLTLSNTAPPLNQIPSWGELQIGVGCILLASNDPDDSYFTVTGNVSDYVINVIMVGTINPLGPGNVFSILDQDYTAQGSLIVFSRPYEVSLTNNNQNSISVLYQPPLGIMQVEDPMAGTFKVSLNPNVDANIAAVQSINSNLTFGTDYDWKVSGIKLYCCVVRKTFSPERSLQLKVMSMSVTNKSITDANTRYEFTVPASSRAFSIFLQSSNVGKQGALVLSPSEFRSLDGKSSTVINLQCTFGSIVLPRSRYTTVDQQGVTINKAYNVTYPNATSASLASNFNVTRYWDYMMTTGKIFSEGGVETFDEWSNSPIYVFDYSNSEDSRATNLTVDLQLAEVPTDNLQMFVVSHYSKSILGEYKANILADLRVAAV